MSQLSLIKNKKNSTNLPSDWTVQFIFSLHSLEVKKKYGMVNRVRTFTLALTSDCHSVRTLSFACDMLSLPVTRCSQENHVFYVFSATIIHMYMVSACA